MSKVDDFELLLCHGETWVIRRYVFCSADSAKVRFMQKNLSAVLL